MGREYEHHETDTDVLGIGAFLDAVLPGEPSGTIAHEVVIKESGEEVGRGWGWSHREARAEAERDSRR